LVVLIEVWKVSEATVLNLILIVPILNLAFSMIMLCLIEWVDLVVIGIYVGNVISDYIKHYPNTLRMSSLYHVSQVLLVSKVGIDLIPIKSGIAMIVVSIIFRDRRNPNCIKAHTLDIVELILNTFEGTTTIL